MGTGRIGGAFLSTSLENSFFGNRVVELDVDREIREEKDKQYKTKKITLGLSAGLIKNKNYGLDIGLIGKHHPKVKKLRAGGGLSGRAGIFTMGFSYYADDLFLNLDNVVNLNTGGLYSTEYNSPTYHERFFVRTFSAWPTSVRLISAAFIYKSFLFNFANRTELSPYWTIKDNVYLIPKKQRNENYGGVQYSVNKYFLFGVHYNYFLLRELSLSGTVFF